MEAMYTTILTWNIWFDPLEKEKRWKTIFTICKQLQPDVICFQEVILDFLLILSQETWIHNYIISDNLQGDTISYYGVITLCKRKYNPSYQFVEFPSIMDRKLLLCHTNEFIVGNVHLESLSSAKIRAMQLEICSEYLSPKTEKSCYLCGDFNFCSYRNWIKGESSLENDKITEFLPFMGDTWVDVHPAEEKGYTFDSEVNKMIPSYEQMRYDRILYSKEKDIPISITLLGNSAIGKTIEKTWNNEYMETVVFPSDHFGLIANFKRV